LQQPSASRCPQGLSKGAWASKSPQRHRTLAEQAASLELRNRETLESNGWNKAILQESTKKPVLEMEKGPDAASQAESFLKLLLGRWESITVEEARRAFAELNGWEPDEGRVGKRSAGKSKLGTGSVLRGWSRGSDGGRSWNRGRRSFQQG
jgi:hypothetical protein